MFRIGLLIFIKSGAEPSEFFSAARHGVAWRVINVRDASQIERAMISLAGLE